MQYAQWGDIIFQVVEFRSVKEENEYIYAEHETIFPPSSLQWMGTELRKVGMSVRWHNQFCNPEESYQKLKELAQKGEAQKLIIATKVWGDFVIKKIAGEFVQIDAWGKPVIIDADIEFEEYVEKKVEQKKIKSQVKKSSTNKTAPAKTQDKKIAESIITRKTNPDGYQYTVIEKKK